jgi:hypothetical protein
MPTGDSGMFTGLLARRSRYHQLVLCYGLEKSDILTLFLDVVRMVNRVRF